MAKHLGKVPIPGAEVVCEGLHFQAESLAGRRNKVVTVVVTPVTPSTSGDDTERRPRTRAHDSATQPRRQSDRLAPEASRLGAWPSS